MNYVYAHVEVRSSEMENAGRGVFARDAFTRGQKIASYTGAWITDDESSLDNGCYCVAVKRNLFLDGHPDHKPPLSSDPDNVFPPIGHLCNDGNASRPRKRNNARFSIHYTRQGQPPLVSIVATRTIKPGDEIIIPYGRGYWKETRSSLTD